MAEKKPTPVNPLTIYFYHTRLTRESYEEWKEYKFPGHILYGLPLLEKYGIRSVMHKHKYIAERWKLMLYVTKEILCCKESYDVLYGTSFRGLEFIILLRALGIYRKPIVIWHHTALRVSTHKIRERISRFFYKGIDHMFLFSKKLIKDSLATGKVPEKKLQLIHWGPDLAFYDHLLQEMPDRNPEGFISTGKENRDVTTLLQAFCATEEELDLYIAPTNGGINYKQIIDSFCLPPIRSYPLHGGSHSLPAGTESGTQKLYCHLLHGLSLHRGAYHIGGSLCIGHPCHLFPQSEL